MDLATSYRGRTFCLVSRVYIDKVNQILYRYSGIEDNDYWIEGYVKQGFEDVKKVFEKNYKLSRELGAQLCVYYEGEKVVDLTGNCKKNPDKKYNAESLQVLFSSTKVITSIAVAYMVDKGYLSYDEKISSYWVSTVKYSISFVRMT